MGQFIADPQFSGKVPIIDSLLNENSYFCYRGLDLKQLLKVFLECAPFSSTLEESEFSTHKLMTDGVDQRIEKRLLEACLSIEKTLKHAKALGQFPLVCMPVDSTKPSVQLFFFHSEQINTTQYDQEYGDNISHKIMTVFRFFTPCSEPLAVAEKYNVDIDNQTQLRNQVKQLLKQHFSIKDIRYFTLETLYSLIDALTDKEDVYNRINKVLESLDKEKFQELEQKFQTVSESLRTLLNQYIDAALEEITNSFHKRIDDLLRKIFFGHIAACQSILRTGVRIKMGSGFLTSFYSIIHGLTKAESERNINKALQLFSKDIGVELSIINKEGLEAFRTVRGFLRTLLSSCDDCINTKEKRAHPKIIQQSFKKIKKELENDIKRKNAEKLKENPKKAREFFKGLLCLNLLNAQEVAEKYSLDNQTQLRNQFKQLLKQHFSIEDIRYFTLETCYSLTNVLLINALTDKEDVYNRINKALRSLDKEKFQELEQTVGKEKFQELEQTVGKEKFQELEQKFQTVSESLRTLLYEYKNPVKSLEEEIARYHRDRMDTLFNTLWPKRNAITKDAKGEVNKTLCSPAY